MSVPIQAIMVITLTILWYSALAVECRVTNFSVTDSFIIASRIIQVVIWVLIGNMWYSCLGPGYKGRSWAIAATCIGLSPSILFIASHLLYKSGS